MCGVSTSFPLPSIAPNNPIHLTWQEIYLFVKILSSYITSLFLGGNGGSGNALYQLRGGFFMEYDGWQIGRQTESQKEHIFYNNSVDSELDNAHLYSRCRHISLSNDNDSDETGEEIYQSIQPKRVRLKIYRHPTFTIKN